MLPLMIYHGCSGAFDEACLLEPLQSLAAGESPRQAVQLRMQSIKIKLGFVIF
jgi:hypothetical protein